MNGRTISLPLAARPGSILVVDDDSAVRRAVSRFLRREGMEVDEASNGEEALARLRQGGVSAVVLDLRMPIMDGWTFRRQQRADKTIADIPVVVMSGADVERFQELQAAAAFEKPAPMAQVAEVLRRICTNATPTQ